MSTYRTWRGATLSNCRLGWIVFGTSRLHKNKILGEKIQARSDKKISIIGSSPPKDFCHQVKQVGFQNTRKCVLGFWHFGHWHHSALSYMIALKGLVLESCGTIYSFIVLIANMVVIHNYLSIIEITEKEGTRHCR